MSKAILILNEMPSKCGDCCLCYKDNFDNDSWFTYRCTVSEDKVEYENIYHLCPLKPMPERKEVRKIKYINDVVFQQTTYDYIANKIHGQIIYDVDRIFAEGYNACIDEILGEEE